MKSRNAFLTLVFSILTLMSFSTYAADSTGKIIIVPLNGFDSTAAATPVGGNFKTTIGEQRLEVFEHAAFLWSTILDLDYDIKVEVQFTALTCSASSATLGYAGPNRVSKINNVWYSTAQANQIQKTDTSGTYNDIYADFNSSIDNGCYNGAPNGWYYGLDNNEPADQEALLDVVLHEIAHGLGFLTFVDGGTGALFNSYIDAYSKHLYDYSRSKSWSSMSDAERLASNNDDALVWSGTYGNADASSKGYSTGIVNGDIKIHAPSSYASGSSISHISTILSPNQLMEPYNTDDGVSPDLEVAMFKDIGYKLKSELAGNTKPVANSYSINVPTNGNVSLDYTANSSEYDGDNINFWKYTTEPSNGTISDMYNGFATYTPNPGFTGSDTVKWVVYDSRMTVSDEGTITFIVGDANIAPVANDDYYDVTSEIYATLNVTVNDTDNDGSVDATSLSIISQASNGTVTIDGTNLRYTSNNGYTGADSFTYAVNDNDGDTSNTATVSLTVHARDIRAVTDDDTFVFNSNTTSSLADVVNNDSDADAITTVLSRFTLTSLPSNGSVTVIGGVPHYTPNTDYVGSDSFTYKISGEGYTPWDSLDATVSITVIDSNTSPVANNDSVSTNEDTMASISPLNNDSDDAPLNLLTLTIVSLPSNGSVVKSGVNFQYTPNANFHGSDSFTYKLTDSGGKDSSVATVTVTVNSVNDLPVANNDSLTVNEDQSGNVFILANDTDADGDVLTYINVNVSQPSNGSVGVESDKVVYTPSANFSGTDSFTYTVSDGTGNSNSATVNVTVSPVVDPAVVENTTVATTEDYDLAPVNLMNYVTAGDNSVASIEISTPASHGVATISGTNLEYTPNANFAGVDTVSYTATDLNGITSNVGVVTINVLAVNDNPVANDDTLSVTRSSTVLHILGNDDDIEDSNSSLAITIVSQPSNGALSVSGTTVSYLVDDSSAATTDSFTYKLTDTEGAESSVANVNINIVSAQAPVSNLDVYSVSEDGSVTMSVTDNDTGDQTFDSVNVSVQPSNGIATVSGLNITYVPNTDFSGQDTFSYVVVDNLGLTSNASQVTVNVSEVNDAPVANNDTLTAVHATETDLKVILNDVDEDISTLNVVVVSAPNHGSFTIQGSIIKYKSNGLFNYTSDSLTYKVIDSHGSTSNVATVDINISHTVPTPVVQNDSYVVADNTTTILNVLFNDTYGTNDLTISIVNDVSNGTLYTYSDRVEYESNSTGSDSFTYTISDELGQVSSTAIVNISIVDSVMVETSDDFVNVNEDNMIVIDVLNNDNVTNFNVLSIKQRANKGDVVVNEDNNLEYTPYSNEVGADSFTYMVTDASGNTSTSSVFVTIVNDNTDFLAVSDSVTVIEDSSVNVDVTFNDILESNNHIVLIKSSPSNGNAEINNSNITYTPTSNFNGSDSFTYAVLNLDTDTESNTTTVNVIVGAANDAPVAVADVFYMNGGEYNELTLLNNDSDMDGDSLTVKIVSFPSNGVLAVNGDSVFYEAAYNYEGTDTLTYYVEDASGAQSDTVSVEIHVAEVRNSNSVNLGNSNSSSGGSLGLFALLLLGLIGLARRKS